MSCPLHCNWFHILVAASLGTPSGGSMLLIRPAVRTDVHLLKTLIHEMGEYERLPVLITDRAPSPAVRGAPAMATQYPDAKRPTSWKLEIYRRA